MVDIAITTNARQVQRWLRGVQRRDIPSAVNVAARDTLSGIRKRMPEEMQRQGVKARKSAIKATMSRPYRVGPGHWRILSRPAGAYLVVLSRGHGVKTGGAHRLAVSPEDQHLTPRRRNAMIDRIMDSGGFMRETSDGWIVYDSGGKGRGAAARGPRPRFVITPNVRNIKRIDWRDFVAREMDENYERHYWRVLESKARRRARRR